MSGLRLIGILMGAIGSLVLYALGLWWTIPLLVALLWWQYRDMTRRTPESPREGWVTLRDRDGGQVGEAIPVTIQGDPLNFTVTNSLTFSGFEGSTVASVRVVDADGNAKEVPIHEAWRA